MRIFKMTLILCLASSCVSIYTYDKDGTLSERNTIPIFEGLYSHHSRTNDDKNVSGVFLDECNVCFSMQMIKQVRKEMRYRKISPHNAIIGKVDSLALNCNTLFNVTVKEKNQSSVSIPFFFYKGKLFMNSGENPEQLTEATRMLENYLKAENDSLKVSRMVSFYEQGKQVFRNHVYWRR